MPRYQPPEAFDFLKPGTWPDWRARFLRYFTLEKLGEEKGEVQVSALVYTMGREAESIYKSFKFPPAPAAAPADVPDDEQAGGEDDSVDTLEAPVDPKHDFKTVIKLFDEYFIPRRNTIHERTKFYQRTQHNGESVENFVRSLHESDTAH